jgi:His/Glu/Gln/Arg/opine family amino acid ABC transporter permease subunit
LLGTVLAVFRVSPVVPLRVGGAVHVEVLRNMPLLSLLILVVFGLPDVGVTFSLFDSAAVCLAACGGAFVCEAVCGGINAVPSARPRPPARSGSPSPSHCDTSSSHRPSGQWCNRS